MTPTPIEALIEALSSGLHRPLYLWTLVVIALAVAGGVLVSRIVRKLRAYRPDLPIIVRARDTAHAAELYRDGASHAVPETLESSLQLSEAVLVDLGVAMGPVIASIHEKRDELRKKLRDSSADTDPPPFHSLRRRRPAS